MSHGPTKYPTKDVCIYCGRRNILLTDEHIVPFAIGGKHIISKASCVLCANITKKFEQDVMRDLWGAARASYNAPTRRKKERPKHFVLKPPKGGNEELTVHANDYPAPMAFYYMPRAGILAGVSPQVDLSREWTLKFIMDQARTNKFEKRYPGRLTFSFKNVPQSFGRMLAKIGHCQVMTALNPSDFNPICLPYILGKRSNVSYVVGSGPNNAPPQPEFGYFLRTVELSTNDRTLLIVEVRLLANNDTPTYHVVVGEVIGRENMKRISQKLTSTALLTETNNPEHISSLTSAYPWTPQVWPVKY